MPVYEWPGLSPKCPHPRTQGFKGSPSGSPASSHLIKGVESKLQLPIKGELNIDMSLTISLKMSKSYQKRSMLGMNKFVDPQIQK